MLAVQKKIQLYGAISLYTFRLYYWLGTLQSDDTERLLLLDPLSSLLLSVVLVLLVGGLLGIHVKS